MHPRLVVFMGEGGVGKTTCAAAFALAEAAQGERVCVLTIDPAPRLGDALGLPAIDGEERPVDLARFGLSAHAGVGALAATKLDTQATFDALVERFSPSPEIAHTVLDHPIYQSIAGRLGGSDAFIAFQRVLDLAAEGRYDVVVVDTPPAAHVDEILSAPVRLGSLVDTGAFGLLADPAQIAARASSRVARGALAALVAAVTRLAGVDIAARISEFAAGFEGVLKALTGRAAEVRQMLQGDACRFVHVLRPSASSANLAAAMADAMNGHGLAVGSWVVNRVIPAPRPRTGAVERLEAETAHAVRRVETAMDALRARDAQAIDALQKEIGPQADLTVIPTSRDTNEGAAGLRAVAAHFMQQN